MSEPASEPIGPYRTQRQLAVGAHAQVWTAKGPEGEVVIKVARGEPHRAAILREVRALEQARGHGVAALLRHASDGSWLAVERVDGQPFDAWAAGKTTGAIARAAVSLAKALAGVHARGVVHGDVKPQNALVSSGGEVRLIDFGAALLADDAPDSPRGTPGFAAPEVLRGERPTARSDLYGLGGVLYAAFTGRKPFAVHDPAALTYLPLVSLPEPPSTHRLDMPGPMNSLVLALLARDPSRRPEPDRVVELLARAADAAPGPGVVGMSSERQQLRQAVVGASDGECRVVVLYGPPGCGRRTLLTEAVEAARREGMPFLKEEPSDALVANIRRAKRPPVIALRATQPGAVAFARALLDGSVPALVLFHSDRPLPALGRAAIALSPPPLAKEHVEALIRHWGGSASAGERVWIDTFGHPASVLARWRVAGSSGAPDLSSTARAVVEALQDGADHVLPELAAAMGLSEHELLDHCAVLFAAERIEPAQEGRAIRLATSIEPPMVEFDE